ncbi:MAG: hypothetical protein GY906_40320 [bacterium]|nr:hypothetical protein [bacterium]
MSPHTDSGSSCLDDPIQSTKSSNPSRGPRWLVLLICFFLSGAAALVYQVAWTRQFALVFGSTEQAIAAVLAAFLGGLGVGAACAARFSSRVSRPVLIYAVLELVAGLSALAVPAAIVAAKHLYVAFFGSQAALPSAGGAALTLFNLGAAFLILAIPTGCMGATLPLLARFAVRTQSEIGSVTGQLYAINTAGAVLGAPLAGFVLLPSLGLESTVMVAVSLNLVAFGASLLISRFLSPLESHPDDQARTQARHQRDWILAILVICSGAVSLLYEVFWTRLLSHLLGGSLVAFSTMLASFLAGIAIGSAIASRFARTIENAIIGFGLAQLGIAVCTAASFGMIVRFPHVSGGAWSSGHSLVTDALVAAIALLPAAFCIGATYPFAVRVLARRARHAAPASARVYGWATLGSIIGSVVAGILLLPALGFARTLAVAIAVNLLLCIASSLFLGIRHYRIVGVAAVALLVLTFFPPSTPWSVLRMGPLYQQPLGGRVEHHAVGRNATVLLTESDGSWLLSSNGLPEGSIQQPGMPMGGYLVTRWLGAIASLTRPGTRSMMVIGFGTGEALHGVPSSVETIDVVELEPEVIRANRSVASRRLRDPLSDPRVRLITNDARSALLLSSTTFDAIVSQPSHPWTSGSANLYTKEFFELIRTRIHPGGVFVQWIGLGFINESLLRSVLATLTDVFPNVIVHRPPTGAALLFIASESPFETDLVAQPALTSVSAELPELGIARSEDLVASLVLNEEGSRALGAGAPLIHDSHNLLEAFSPKTVGHALGRDLADGILSPFDPLNGESGFSVDNAYLIRRLLSIRHGMRARRLAEVIHDPAQRQIALALLAEASGRIQLAWQLTSDALNRGQQSSEVRALVLRLQRIRIMRGGQPDGRLMPLTDIEQAIVESWRLQGQGEWPEVASLEATLAIVQPGEALFREAIRLRVLWRLAVGGQDNAKDAVNLVDPLLARGRTADDLLLRAQAASASGDPQSTLASLSALAYTIGRLPQRESWARPARTLLGRLPPDPDSADWRSSLIALLAEN